MDDLLDCLSEYENRWTSESLKEFSWGVIVMVKSARNTLKLKCHKNKSWNKQEN